MIEALANRPGHRALAVLAAAAAAAGVAGCAGTIRVGSRRSVTVDVSEYRLRPASLQAPTGQLQISVRNLGRLTHDLVVARGNSWVAATRPLFPGQSQTLTLNLPRGTYSIFSSLLSDQALGAYGTLEVGR